TDIAVSCDEVDRPVRQIRVCIEVLRLLIGAAAPGEDSYRSFAYGRLLGAAGTSFEELRVSRAGTPDERSQLADRLGIALTTADELGQLILDGPTLTEAGLEQLFGLIDTTRDPLTDGIIVGDAAGQIIRITLRGT